MSEKMYPPGANVSSANDPPPAYTGVTGEPSSAAAGPPSAASYPKQAGVAPVAPASTAQMPGGDHDIRFNKNNVTHLRNVPAYPLCLAVTFYIINCIIPGLGMWLGCLCLCCSNTVVQGDSMIKILCITFWLGFASILTLAFGIGYWIAIIWSVGTIATNRMYYNKQIQESEIRAPNPMAMGNVF